MTRSYNLILKPHNLILNEVVHSLDHVLVCKSKLWTDYMNKYSGFNQLSSREKYSSPKYLFF